MSSRPSGTLPDGSDDVRLDSRERARIDEAVVTVARRGRGTVVVAALVVAAFLLGLVRPWDWLADGPPPGEVAVVNPGPDDARPGGTGMADDGSAPGVAEPTGPVRAATCGYPSSWRTASISFWAGARARIWTAAEAVSASGPADPAIPFHAIASDRVEAIGWCAPVSGPGRPPLAAEATLYRLRDGAAVEVTADRLEPPAGDALGELWVPRPQRLGRRPPWAPGRYVIRLATSSGTYERFLGLEVGVPPRIGDPAPGASPPGDSPGASPPGDSPGASPPGGPSPGTSPSPGPSPSP